MVKIPFKIVDLIVWIALYISIGGALVNGEKSWDSEPGLEKLLLRRTRRSEGYGEDEGYSYHRNELGGFLPQNYSSFIPESSTLKIEVMVQFEIGKILGLDERNEVLSMDAQFQMTWTDDRLNKSALVDFNLNHPSFEDCKVDCKFVLPLSPKLIRYIWHPDMCLDELVSVKQPTFTNTPAAALWVFKNLKDTRIYLETKFALETSCDMDYHKYPADETTCDITLRSYGYPDSVLITDWNSPPLLPADVNVPGFQVRGRWFSNLTFVGSFYNTHEWNYTAVRLTIYLQRHLGFYIMQRYLPSVMFVVISWFSYLIPEEHASERVGCAMVSLLSLMVMLDSIGSDIPQVTYVTGLHIWIFACIASVFATLLEIFLVLRFKSYIKKCRTKHRSFSQRKKSVVEGSFPVRSDQVKVRWAKVSEERLEWIERFTLKMRKFTPYILPIFFALFNCWYWPWLLSKEEQLPDN